MAAVYRPLALLARCGAIRAAPLPCSTPGLWPPPTTLQVFYYVVMALFGTMKGIVQLNLGAISTFQVGQGGHRWAGGGPPCPRLALCASIHPWA